MGICIGICIFIPIAIDTNIVVCLGSCSLAGLVSVGNKVRLSSFSP